MTAPPPSTSMHLDYENILGIGCNPAHPLVAVHCPQHCCPDHCVKLETPQPTHVMSRKVP